MFCKPLATAVLAVVLSAAGWAFFQGGFSNPSKTVKDSKTCTFYVPSNATVQDRAVFAHNFAFGTTDPTTLSFVESKGEVKGVLTGVTLQPSGERQLIVTIVDDPPDLIEASVVLNDQVVAVGTHVNGGVIDRNGSAIATFSVLIPAAAPFEIIAKWTSSTGEIQESQVNL